MTPEIKLLAIVVVGFLLMFGAISRARAFHILGGIALCLLLAPFAVDLYSRQEAWAKLLLGTIGLIWVAGATVRVVAGKTVRDLVVARFIEEFIQWPFRVVGWFIGALFRSDRPGSRGRRESGNGS